MGNATLRSLDIGKAGPGNIIRWSAFWSSANINSTWVGCPVDDIGPLLARAGDEGDLILTDAHVIWDAVTSGAGNLAWLSIGHSSSVVNLMPVSSATSTVRYTMLEYHGRNVVNQWKKMPSGDIIFYFQTGAVTTTDDVFITLEGAIYTPPDVPIAQSVSLEGYKWPLTRRQ